MMNLDDTGALRAGDPSGMLGHLEGFPEQLERALEIGRRATLTLSGRGARAVVVAGMGGSAIGGEIAAAHLAGSISVPMIVVRNYEMPAFVGADTVVVAASYSGNTEETLAAYRDAHARGARVLCVTTGGELAARAADDGHDVIAIPGGLPPRAALGYGLVPLLVSLARLGLSPDPGEDVADAVAVCRRSVAAHGAAAPAARNPAKEIAGWLCGGLPVIYGTTPRTAAAASRWCGQLAENSKVVAHRAEIPEMNHNEIVGWSGERPLCGSARVVFLGDPGDHPRNALRADFTRREVEAAGAAARVVTAAGATALGRLMSLVSLGDFVSVYLAALGGVDPTPVEPIGRLKSALGEAPAEPSSGRIS
ncbi:MAG: bifunctional phosphoglucose/phosphomannose isomerase [Candidatus Eisenbacteria bacterium]|nr:bifunctional phosphoglucose/phosphomannose isomerase [Candidatus Eisenbacteria bacterium]